MIGIIDLKIQAHNPQFPLHPVNAIVGSPSSVRLRDIPKKIGDWKIDRVYVDVKYPDNTVLNIDTKLVGGVYVATFEGCATAGTSTKGFVVKADGVDENGTPVNGYVLGVGDIYILDNDGRIVPQDALKVVNIVDEKSSTPHVGDAIWNENAQLEIFDGVEWKQVGSGIIESTDFPGYAEKAREAVYANESVHAEIATVANSVEWDNVQNKPDVVVYDNSEESEKKIVIDGRENGNSVLELNSLNGSLIDLKSDDGLFRIDEYGFTNKFSDGTKREIFASCSEFDVSGDLKENGKRVATQEYVDSKIPTKVSQLDNDVGYATQEYVDSNIPAVNDSTITITQGGETKGTFTLNQATPSTIELDAGGGSDGGCIIEVFQYYGTTSQNLTWNNKDGKQCKITTDTDIDGVRLYVSNTYRYQQIARAKGVSVPVVGNISINWDGYSSDSEILLDGCRTDSRPTVIDSSLYKHILINFMSCLEENTQITMADGSTKAVKDIEIGDIVMSMNPYTGKLEPDEATLGYCGEKLNSGDTADEWTFDDGTILKTVHPHQFYNVRTDKMEYISNFQIGDKVRKQDGTETSLVKHELILKRTKYATLFTRKFNNYFANGILTGNRKSVKWGWYWIEQNKENSNED